MAGSMDDMIVDKMEITDDYFKLLLDLLANQRQAIYELAEIIGEVPDADKSKLAAVIKSLDNSDLLAALSDNAPT